MPRPEQTQTRVRWANNGWVAIQAIPAGSGEDLLMRLAPDETGRYRIRELHIHDTGEPITAQRLRAIPLGSIESRLNLPGERDEISHRYEFPLAGPIGSEQFFDHGLFRPALYPIIPLAVAKPRKLKVPAGRGYPDSFYEAIAERYREALRQNRRPVMAIAHEAGVPRSTAGRWVKEARKRGKLGAAQPGKAGDFRG